MTYSCFLVDAEHESLASSAKKYRALRLSALSQSPSSFSSTYEIESQFTDEWWESRLQIPGRKTFICAIDDSSDSTCSVSGKRGEWVGQVTLLGPVAASAYSLPDAAQQPPVAGDEQEEKWQMLSLFTLPSHRGKGIAKALCSEVFRWLQENEGSDIKPRPSQLRVRIMVKPENTATVKLYEGLGFAHAGKCTLAEALVANGDAELVPADGGGSKYQERSGLIMAAIFQRK